jgi:hypothetical protein
LFVFGLCFACGCDFFCVWSAVEIKWTWKERTKTSRKFCLPCLVGKSFFCEPNQPRLVFFFF